ncbi:MAG: hypothetical protein FJ034_08915, partial [Chloroflexi bacterium]|nr:hypothetical protein [Chloroflexota bacterium]
MRRGSESERERQGAATRGAVRAAGMAMVFGIAFMLMIDGLLPTTTASDRVGLFTTALMVVVAGILWFFFIPRLWFGPSRVLLAATVSQTVLLALVAQTGGVQGRYLPYLALPMIALV